MASITKYQTTKGTRWRVDYTRPDGKNTSKRGFQRKTEAQQWAANNTVKLATGDWIDPHHGRTTIAALEQQWKTSRKHTKPSVQRVELLDWENHVKPYWGDRALVSIRQSEVVEWVHREGPWSASSRRHHHAVLRQVLDIAVADKMIRSNPAAGIKLPRKNQPVKVYWSMAQLRAVAEHSSRPELVWLLGTTGLRWGEAVGLQVRDLKVLRSRISVERSAVLVGSKIVVGMPKTHERRVVACPRHVMGMLAKLTEGKRPDDWVWESPVGGPLRTPGKGNFLESAIRRVNRSIVEGSGVLGISEVPSVTPHGLRHVAAGLLVSAGANVKVVQTQLGHKSAAMTLDVYAELFDEDLDAVASVLDGLCRAVS